jgi:hypothetical protein
MRQQQDDLRDCPTAHECRERLPAFAASISDDVLNLSGGGGAADTQFHTKPRGAQTRT